jgi:hypothetical protein
MKINDAIKIHLIRGYNLQFGTNCNSNILSSSLVMQVIIPLYLTLKSVNYPIRAIEYLNVSGQHCQTICSMHLK